MQEMQIWMALGVLTLVGVTVLRYNPDIGYTRDRLFWLAVFTLIGAAGLLSGVLWSMSFWPTFMQVIRSV